VRHVVMYSGGIGSWAAAKRVVAEHGPQDVTLLFTDTLIEDPDVYRFLRESAANVGAPLVEIADGRTPWQVFRDRKFLGNSRIDPCSHHLKRDMGDKWLKANCDPADTIIYVGIDWSEIHRIERLAVRKREQGGWDFRAPLCDPPWVTKDDMIAAASAEGLEPPSMYAQGFAHANCGGFCVKGGHGHFRTLLAQKPEVYAHHEAEEQSIRELLGNVAILRDHSAEGKPPLTMREFRERVEAGWQPDLFDVGGCGCFVDTTEGEP
jgi:hypothetical protein